MTQEMVVGLPETKGCKRRRGRAQGRDAMDLAKGEKLGLVAGRPPLPTFTWALITLPARTARAPVPLVRLLPQLLAAGLDHVLNSLDHDRTVKVLVQTLYHFQCNITVSVVCFLLLPSLTQSLTRGTDQTLRQPDLVSTGISCHEIRIDTVFS